MRTGEIVRNEPPTRLAVLMINREQDSNFASNARASLPTAIGEDPA